MKEVSLFSVCFSVAKLQPEVGNTKQLLLQSKIKSLSTTKMTHRSQSLMLDSFDFYFLLFNKHFI